MFKIFLSIIAFYTLIVLYLKVFKRQIITIPRNSCIISGATIDVSNSSDNDSKCCTIFFKEANLIYETDLEDKCENFCPSINSNND